MHRAPTSINKNVPDPSPKQMIEQGDSLMRNSPSFIISNELKQRYISARENNYIVKMKDVRNDVRKVSNLWSKVFLGFFFFSIPLSFLYPIRGLLFGFDNLEFSFLSAILPFIIGFIMFFGSIILSITFSALNRNCGKCIVTKKEEEEILSSIDSTLSPEQQYHLYQKLSKSFVKCSFCETTNELENRCCKSCGAKL